MNYNIRNILFIFLFLLLFNFIELYTQEKGLDYYNNKIDIPKELGELAKVYIMFKTDILNRDIYKNN